MHIKNSLKQINSKSVSFHVDIDARAGHGAGDFSFVLLVRPLGEDALVQVQENRVERLHLSVEDALHVSVCAERFLNVSNATALGAQLARLEVVDVLVVVEHEADGGGASVDLEGMSAKHHPLEYDTVGSTRQQTSTGNEGDGSVRILPQTHDGRRWELNWSEE